MSIDVKRLLNQFNPDVDIIVEGMLTNGAPLIEKRTDEEKAKDAIARQALNKEPPRGNQAVPNHDHELEKLSKSLPDELFQLADESTDFVAEQKSNDPNNSERNLGEMVRQKFGERFQTLMEQHGGAILEYMEYLQKNPLGPVTTGQSILETERDPTSILVQRARERSLQKLDRLEDIQERQTPEANKELESLLEESGALLRRSQVETDGVERPNDPENHADIPQIDAKDQSSATKSNARE